MDSINYTYRVKNVAAAGKIIDGWDFTKPCQVLSICNLNKVTSESSNLPDIQDIMYDGDVVCGENIKRRIEFYDGDITVYEFRIGHYGLCLADKRESHFIIYDSEDGAAARARAAEYRAEAYVRALQRAAGGLF